MDEIQKGEKSTGYQINYYPKLKIISYSCTNLNFYFILFADCVGDVDGSIEAISDALQTFKSRKISLNVLSADVGAISENDIKLADTFKGKFNSILF